MTELGVALLQLRPTGRVDANTDKGEEYCRRARHEGADVALFPEMWSTGYEMPDPADRKQVDRWLEQAADDESVLVQRYSGLARELDMAIAFTYLERWPGAPRNSVRVVDRHGRTALTFAKVHTCAFDREALLTRGSRFEVADLDTAHGSVKIGAMICYDREFPESARLLMLAGAEVVLVPNACPMDQNRAAQLRARAFENMFAIALANYPQSPCFGRSMAFDGMAFAEDESSRDMLLVEAGADEGMWIARIDLDALRDYRRRETWGDAYRRPSLYGALAAGTPGGGSPTPR